jgi:hypothetical protein
MLHLLLFQLIKLVAMKVIGQCLHRQEETLMLGVLLLVLMVLGPILALKAADILTTIGIIPGHLVRVKTQVYHMVLGQELLLDQWLICPLLLGT